MQVWLAAGQPGRRAGVSAAGGLAGQQAKGRGHQSSLTARLFFFFSNSLKTIFNEIKKQFYRVALHCQSRFFHESQTAL